MECCFRRLTARGICKLCVQFDERGSIKTKDGRGRKKATTSKTDRRELRLALQNRRATYHEIHKVLLDTRVMMSNKTVRRRLAAAVLKARVPRKKPFLDVLQRKMRLQWARSIMDT